MLNFISLGKSFYDIASRFNIGISTIKDLLKKRNQINDAVKRNKSMGFTRKTLREGNFPDVENRLYEWVSEKLDDDEIITNNLLLQKATEITRDLKKIEWKPSKGWLSKFKQRYSLTAVKEEYVEENCTELKYEEEDGRVELEDIEPEEVTEDIKSETIEVYNFPIETQITPLEAADRLLDFVVANDFPLKEVITLRVIRDRIIEMHDVGNVVKEQDHSL